MSAAPNTQRENQSFAETALRLGGKSGRGSPPHRGRGQGRRAGRDAVRAAVPDRQQPGPQGRLGRQGPARPVRAAAAAGRRPVRRGDGPARWTSSAGTARPDTLYDEHGKVVRRRCSTTWREAGYWGMLIDPKYGGQGAPFARFARFLTRMATLDPMIAGLASVHGCIGAVDPVRTFGTPEQKQRFLPRLASGEALSALRPDRAVRRLRPDRPADHRRRSTATTTRSPARSCSSPTSSPAGPIGLVVHARRQAGRADRRSAAAGERAVPDRALRPVRPAARVQQRPASSTTSACRRRTCSRRRSATA